MVDKYLIGDQVVFPSVTVGIDSQNTFNLVAVTGEVECDIPGEIFCFYRIPVTVISKPLLLILPILDGILSRPFICGILILNNKLFVCDV